MSQLDQSVDRVSIYCNADGTCSVKRTGEEAPSRRCPTLTEAVALAHDLKTGRSLHMTVYDSTGKVLLQSFA